MDLITKLRAAVQRYGWWATLRYGVWAVMDRMGVSPARRRQLLRGLARLFETLHIAQLPVHVNGVRLYIDPRNAWSVRAYVLTPTYDQMELQAIRKVVSSDRVFIDVGANFGAWTFPLAAHFKSVISVEPDPRCFACCVRTATALKYAHVTLVHAALSDENGEGVLFPSAANSGDSRVYDPHDAGRLPGSAVSLITMDTLIRRYPLQTNRVLMKLDAQGAEPRILRAMTDTLGQVQDLILFIELQESILTMAGSSVSECLALLKTLGFLPVDLFRGLLPVEWGRVPEALSRSKDYCFRYCNPVKRPQDPLLEVAGVSV